MQKFVICELENICNILKITASSPLVKGTVSRIMVTKLSAKTGEYFFLEKFVGKQAFQQKLTNEQLQVFVDKNIVGQFKQVAVVTTDGVTTYLSNGKGNVKRLFNKQQNLSSVAKSQNRQKKYILSEGLAIQPLVDLGVFTKDYKVVNSMYDKYKQINRFVEILDDKFGKCTQPLTILDFGCGKSYLTFIVYYYFVKIKGLDVNIIGYDLKADVVNNCNLLAQKYGYDKLSFIIADVTKDKLFDKKVDAVICLHACDVATDFALHYAVKHDASFIFAVPCCQHEINSQISCGGDMDLLLKHGIVKERVSALLTDSIRAAVLEDCGYSVDVMEFVDLAHSPKNLMIRAEKIRKPSNKNYAAVSQLCQQYGFRQTLFDLIYPQN